MSSENIGKVIQELRKTKKATQEELAATVGVSTQAVSRWENGGTPDIELLPAIAEFFGVTIDKLFGRDTKNYDNIEAFVAEYIISLEENQKYEKWFEMFWAMQKALMGIPTRWKSLERIGRTASEDTYTFSDSTLEFIQNQAEKAESPFTYSMYEMKKYGISSLSLLENQQYAFLMKKPTDGYSKMVLPVEEYQKLFAVLGDIDYLKTLFFFYKREEYKRFTEELLVNNLKISEEKAKQIIKTLFEYDMLRSEEIEINDDTKTIYSFKARHSFIPFLLFAGEMIKQPNQYWFAPTMGGDIFKLI